MAAGVMALFAPGLAHADDWLAVWPPCSIPDAALPEFALLYPAPGLPALVHAGDSLVIRIRTPAALTPPPGVQQERALASFDGELSAPAARVGVASTERHRQALPVTSVRPDTANTLVYRVRLQVPAYVAEGTYALSLRTPFGIRRAEQAVRVLATGARPRLRPLPAGLLLPPMAAATRPVDVWLSDGAAAEPAPPRGHDDAAAERALPNGLDDAPADSAPPSGHDDAPAEPAPPNPLDDAAAAGELAEAAPTLLTHGAAFALRVGAELWVHSGCADTRAFEREVAGVLANEKRTRVDLTALSDPAGREVLKRVAPPPSAAELARAPAIVRRDDALELDNRSRDERADLSLLVPFGANVHVDAGTLSFHPAREPSARTPVAKIARWHVPAAVRARLWIERTDPPADGALALRPQRAHSGQPTRVQIDGADARARVAFKFGFAQNAYARPSVTTSFSGPLAQPVRAQVFSRDGAARVVQGHVWVEPHRPPNCAAAPGLPPGARATGAFWRWLAVAGAVVMAIRRSKKRRTGSAPE